jgi:cytochrome c peroxidase
MRFIIATSILFFACFIAAFKLQQSAIPSYPSYFPAPTTHLNTIGFDTLKIQIGRVLFYDGLLSADGTISCASCHSQHNAFAHSDHTLSHGINDSIGKRNAPPLFNLAWQKSMMWDGAVKNVNLQALAPITGHMEMGENLPNVLKKLNASTLYKKLFYAAYGDSTITTKRLLQTLEQFQLTLISATSKYDDVKNNKAQFNSDEQRGYTLFKQNCNTCHKEPLFSTYQFANNGLPINKKLNDYGRFAVTQNKNDSFKFKIPSLRNLGFTMPYMHDGRFNTLTQVLNHYTTPNIKKTDLTKIIQFNDIEKKDLLAFLNTLNDEVFIYKSETKFPKKILTKKTK